MVAIAVSDCTRGGRGDGGADETGGRFEVYRCLLGPPAVQRGRPQRDARGRAGPGRGHQEPQPRGCLRVPRGAPGQPGGDPAGPGGQHRQHQRRRAQGGGLLLRGNVLCAGGRAQCASELAQHGPAEAHHHLHQPQDHHLQGPARGDGTSPRPPGRGGLTPDRIWTPLLCLLDRRLSRPQREH
eukprot:scaffold44106_cov39-Prasinocladus_malaysianus.AAC.2